MLQCKKEVAFDGPGLPGGFSRRLTPGHDYGILYDHLILFSYGGISACRPEYTDPMTINLSCREGVLL